MFAPAAFDDAAARFLETTDLPAAFRWDPHGRRWVTRDGETWTPVPTEVAVTFIGRFLADEFEFLETVGAPIPFVLSGVPKATTWAHLRAKVTRSAANSVTRFASGSPAFHGLPGLADPTPSRPVRDPAPVPALSAWLSAALVPAPGAFVRRSSLVVAFRAVHGPDSATQKAMAQAALEVLGPPRKRGGQYGWPDLALATACPPSPALTRRPPAPARTCPPGPRSGPFGVHGRRP